MNKYIEEYISKQQRQSHEDKKTSIAEVINELKIGKKEYLSEFDGMPTMDFPFYDMAKNDYYRYNVGEVTDEEFEEMLKYMPEDSKPGKTRNVSKMSFWYWFAIAMMAIGIIGGIVVASEHGGEADGIGIIVGSMIMLSQIILLSRIEFNTRKTR